MSETHEDDAVAQEEMMKGLNKQRPETIDFVELGDVNKSEITKQEAAPTVEEDPVTKKEMEAEAREAFIDASEIRPPHTEESMIARFESHSKEFPQGQTFTDKLKEAGSEMQKPLQEMNKSIKAKKGWVGKLVAALGGIGWLAFGLLYLGGTAALAMGNFAARQGIGGGQK